LRICGDDSGQHIAVATDELRGAVQNEDCAVAYRLLQNGRGKGVVDQDRNIAGLRADIVQVQQRQGGICWRLDNHQTDAGRSACAISFGPTHVTSTPSSPLSSRWSVPP